MWRADARSITHEGLWWKPPLGPVRLPPTDRPVFFVRATPGRCTPPPHGAAAPEAVQAAPARPTPARSFASASRIGRTATARRTRAGCAPGSASAAADRHPHGGADKHVNLRDKLRDLLYGLYARRVEGHLDHAQVPKHIGVILDGNRRWAKAAGGTTAQGHRAGADKIEEFLGWCSETDVEVVTLWLLSTDNLDRPAGGARPAPRHHRGRRARPRRRRPLARPPRRHAGPAARPDADRAQGGRAGHRPLDGILVNVAIGYGGRQEIADAVRSMLLDARDKGTSIEELAEIRRHRP